MTKSSSRDLPPFTILLGNAPTLRISNSLATESVSRLPPSALRTKNYLKRKFQMILKSLSNTQTRRLLNLNSSRRCSRKKLSNKVQDLTKEKNSMILSKQSVISKQRKSSNKISKQVLFRKRSSTKTNSSLPKKLSTELLEKKL